MISSLPAGGLGLGGSPEFHVSHVPGHLLVLVAVTVSGRLGLGLVGVWEGAAKLEPRSCRSVHVGAVGSSSQPRGGRAAGGCPAGHGQSLHWLSLPTLLLSGRDHPAGSSHNWALGDSLPDQSPVPIPSKRPMRMSMSTCMYTHTHIHAHAHLLSWQSQSPGATSSHFRPWGWQDPVSLCPGICPLCHLFTPLTSEVGVKGLAVLRPEEAQFGLTDQTAKREQQGVTWPLCLQYGGSGLPRTHQFLPTPR